MKTRARALAVAGILAVMLVPPAATFGQTGDEPVATEDPATAADPDQALAEDLEAELQALIEEFGLDVDPATLVGEPGDLDLPPGELVYDGLVVAATGTDLPDGGGSSLDGPCLGISLSFKEDGTLLDAAADLDPAAPPRDLVSGGQAFTSSNPYEVDVNGYVVYAGRADPPPLDHTWFVRVQGVNLDAGGDDNPQAENRNAGSVDLKEVLPAPAKVSALFYADGKMTANKGAFNCNGSGFIKTVGGIPILGGLGLIFALVGGLGALFNARPAKTWRA